MDTTVAQLNEHSQLPGEIPIASSPRATTHWQSFGRVILQLSLILGAALAYFGVRGLTEGREITAIANGRGLLDVEHTLGVDFESSAQSWILDHRALVTAANWVYIWGHWPVIALALIWLYRNHRHSYLLLRNAMFISGAIGLIIFMTFPVAPPRLMPGAFVDTVTELSSSYRVLQPPSLINKFAAVPSLHVGWNLLVGITLFRKLRHPLARGLAVTSPLIMASAVILTANHYVLDAVAGSVVAVAGLLLAAFLGLKGAAHEHSELPQRATDSHDLGREAPCGCPPLEHAA
jgi:hypothetical protein